MLTNKPNKRTITLQNQANGSLLYKISSKDGAMFLSKPSGPTFKFSTEPLKFIRMLSDIEISSRSAIILSFSIRLSPSCNLISSEGISSMDIIPLLMVEINNVVSVDYLRKEQTLASHNIKRKNAVREPVGRHYRWHY